MLYKDLPSDLNAEPLEDKAAVKQAIYNLFHTRKGEMPGKPELGCPIDRYVFEQMDSTLQSLLQGDITNALTNYEPRIQVQSVNVELQEAYNRIDIEIQYKYSGVQTSEYDSITFSI